MLRIPLVYMSIFPMSHELLDVVCGSVLSGGLISLASQ